MLATKKLAGGAPEMNVRNPLHVGVEAYKWGIHPGFEHHLSRLKKSQIQSQKCDTEFQKGVLLTFQVPSAIRLCYSNNLILQVQNQGLFRRICFHYPGRPSMY